MRRSLVLFLLFALSFALNTCAGDYVNSNRVIHISIQSEPQGAEVYFRIVSNTPDVKSSNRLYLGITPYRGTRTLEVPGLTRKNISDVSFVVMVSKNGYEDYTERYNLSGVLNDLEISGKYKLVPKK